MAIVLVGHVAQAVVGDSFVALDSYPICEDYGRT